MAEQAATWNGNVSTMPFAPWFSRRLTAAPVLTLAAALVLPGAGLAVSAAALMSASPAIAQEAPTGSVTSLQDALIAAYNSNPTLLAERARLRATDETVAQANSGWRPTVTASASYTWADTTGNRTVSQSPTADTTLNEVTTGVDFNNDGDFTDSFLITPGSPGGTFETPTDETAKTTDLSITATQTVFRGLRTLREVRQAKANVRAGRAQLRATEQDVLLSAVTAYMDVLRDEAVLRLSQNNVQVLTRQLEASRDRFRVGEITRTDVAQAEARLSGAQSNLIASEAQLIASRSAFERVIGTVPGNLQAPPPLPSLPQAESEARENALSRNPQLKAARRAEEASRQGVGVASGALLPTVNVQGRYSESDTTSEGGADIFTGDRDSQTTSFVATVNVPLYQAGAVYSQVRQAKQLNSEDRLQIAEAERQVIESVAIAWEGLRSASATIESSREQVRANEIAFEGVQQEAQVGSRTTLDVLDAEQELLDSRVTLVRAERDEYVAAFQLLSATGDLTAEDLSLPTQYYDPEEHYDDVKGRWIGLGSR